MHLLLMRHGIAEDGTPDEERRLTRKGERRVETLAGVLDRLDFRPDVLLCSPLVRAVETAKIVAKTMDLDAEIEKTPALEFAAPWEHFEAVANDRLRGAGRSAVVLAVGHMPQLGMLATVSIHGAEGPFEIAKGAVVGVRFRANMVEPGGGDLRFYLTSSLAKRF